MKKWLFTAVMSLTMLVGYAQSQPTPYTQAIDSARLVVTKARERVGELHPDYASALYGLADIYSLADRYTESEALLRQVLTIRKAKLGEQHPDYVTTLVMVGMINNVLGRYKIAEPYYVQALAIQKATLGVEHEDYFDTLKQLAFLQKQWKGSRASFPYYQELLALQKKKLGEQNPEYVSTLITLARAYEAAQWYEDAEVLYAQLLSQRKSQYGEHHLEYAAALQRQADLYRETKRYDQAELLYRQILQIRKQKLGENDEVYVQGLYRLGMLYLKMGRYADAVGPYEQTERVYRARKGEQDSDYLTVGAALADIYDRVGRFKEAVAVQSRVIELEEQEQRKELESITVGDASFLLYAKQDNSNLYQSLLLRSRAKEKSPSPTGTGTAFNHALFLKGNMLASAISNKRQILASRDTALIRRYTQLQALRRKYADAHKLTLLQQRERGLNTADLEASIKALEKEMTVRSVALAGKRPHPTWQQIQQALKPGEAAIELTRFFWFPQQRTDTIPNDTVYYAAYVLLPNNKEPELVVFKNGADLQGKYLKTYLQLTNGPGGHRGAVDVATTDKEAAVDTKELYGALWQPIARVLPAGTKTVYLSPDGVYLQLNLTTLQNPATGKHVLDEVDIRLVGSTREIVDRPAQSPAATTGQSILIGAPTYRLANYPLPEPITDKNGYTLISRGKGLQANYAGRYEADDHFLENSNVASLPGTRREIVALDTLLKKANWAAKHFTGDAATEEQVMAVRQPRVLHIATHGFTLGHVERFSNPRYSDSIYVSVARARDPLLRCGLLLAGVSNYRDAEEKPARQDGILTGYEASLLDLEGTELVVLSACETGVGEVQSGEGVYGLQRGFAMAGAKSIMVSLWKVDDDVTRELMVAFYRNWLGGQTKRAALASAQQLVRSKHPNPFYWGAFLLFGE